MRRRPEPGDHVHETTESFVAGMRGSLKQVEWWQPIETAPDGYKDGVFTHVLFLGTSKARSFSGDVVVSGWMDHERKPVHNYSYKLIITHWQPMLAPPSPNPHAGGET